MITRWWFRLTVVTVDACLTNAQVRRESEQVMQTFRLTLTHSATHFANDPLLLLPSSKIFLLPSVHSGFSISLVTCDFASFFLSLSCWSNHPLNMAHHISKKRKVSSSYQIKFFITSTCLVDLNVFYPLPLLLETHDCRQFINDKRVYFSPF